MPNLTDLTDEECIFLFEVLKQEENRQRLPGVDATGGNAPADKNRQQKMLKDLLWRLHVVCTSPSEFDKALDKELAAQRLGRSC